MTNPHAIYQLRTYSVRSDLWDVFTWRFGIKTVPIMRELGFDFVGSWSYEEDDQVKFIYVLRWSDADAMDAAWDAFRADPRWLEVKQSVLERHGEPVSRVESQLMADFPLS